MPTSPINPTGNSPVTTPSTSTNNSDIPPANFAVPDLNTQITGLNGTDVSYNPNSDRVGYGVVEEFNTTAAARPKVIPASIVKQKLLKPALTSLFETFLIPPEEVKDWMYNRNLNIRDPNNQELLLLSCSEASLPGSRLSTLELRDDHHGVTERHAYRREFDDSASFTFYVDAPEGRDVEDRGYKIIWFFEQWKSFIMGEGSRNGNSRRHKDDEEVRLDDYNWYYRVKFPKSYQTDIFITKFERDYDLRTIKKEGTRRYLEYKFTNAYPISINTIPVSYDSSQLLKCTVTFNYSRYIVRRKKTDKNDLFGEPSTPRQQPRNNNNRNRNNDTPRDFAPLLFNSLQS